MTDIKITLTDEEAITVLIALKDRIERLEEDRVNDTIDDVTTDRFIELCRGAYDKVSNPDLFFIMRYR